MSKLTLARICSVAAFGGSVVSVPSCSSASTRSSAAGQRLEVGAHPRFIAAAPVGLRHVRQRDRGGRAEHPRDPRSRPRALFGEPPPRLVALGEAETGDAARHRLQVALSPALRLLDACAKLGIGGQQGRLGANLVERSRDLARVLDSATVELERGERAATKADDARVQLLARGYDVDELVVEALHVEHLAHRLRGMRKRRPIQLHRHDATVLRPRGRRTTDPLDIASSCHVQRARR